ncbi:MAG: metallophosphoesterase [Patescibacteria group bacterium]
MNFLLIITYGYVAVAAIMIFFIIRDRRKPELFFARHRRLSVLCLSILVLGIFLAFYSTLVEPFILKTTKVELNDNKLQHQIKIAFVSDIQVGQWKKSDWVKKIVKKIIANDPDIVILGGDLIDNEGTFEDESEYLEPLANLVSRYPVYYVLGNHEYGIGGHIIDKPEKHTGDRSLILADRMREMGIALLKNNIVCPEINNQKICLFGIDDIWKNKQPDFSELNNWDEDKPLIFITHNPDGILSYPANFAYPTLTLAGHTHGGQIWIPLWGPLAGAQTILENSYYRGMNYYNGSPIYISVGAGESGAPLRLFAIPEVVIITLDPNLK